jgi:dolichol-phosphate mannosyltransferase
MQPTTQHVTIVTPTLNEVGSLNQLIIRIDRAMKQIGSLYEIIVVDDHSTDGTVALAHSLSQAYPIRFLTKQGEKGKAQSLLEGFAAAKYDIIAMIDADLQYPPEALVPMVNRLNNSMIDVVLSRRQVNETTAFRKLSSFTYNLVFARLIHGLAYDTQSGLKVFRRRLLANLSLKPTPWSFDLEFIVRTRQQGAVIVEESIVFASREHDAPKINFATAVVELAKASLVLKLTLIKERTNGLKGYQS